MSICIQSENVIFDRQQSIIDHGWAFIPCIAEEVKAKPFELNGFAASWNHLPKDPYMPSEVCSRYRRFQRFDLDVTRRQLNPSSDRRFFQGEDINSAFGGINREFAPMDANVRDSRVLGELIFGALDVIPLGRREKVTSVNVHQIRIIASEDIIGLPTPEGIHQDGHDFVAQVMINRFDVKRAISNIYDLDKNLIGKLELRLPLEAIVVDDARVFHSVDPVTSRYQAQGCTRDMLLIDFNGKEG